MLRALDMMLVVIAVFGIGVACAQNNDRPLVSNGNALRCASRFDDSTCHRVEIETLRLTGSETDIARIVTVDPNAFPDSRPLMVTIIAMASSEIAWNGTVIGRNGRPAPDRAHEIPGAFISTFVVPQNLVRPGVNRVTARLSAHHLWLPVRKQVHVFAVGPYESPDYPGLSAYLPALLALGALLGAGAYFAAAAFSDERGARTLAAIAGLALLQLLAETARTFINYSYPWHLTRVSAIAALAALTASFVAAYVAQRFSPQWQRTVQVATGAAALACVILIPWFDFKALGAILAGIIAIIVCAAKGVRDAKPFARVALGVGITLLLLMLYQTTDFLDRAYYLSLATLLVALAAEQVSVLRQTRQEREAERERAADLEGRLQSARRSGQSGPTILLKDGARTYSIAGSDILFVKAADDYCEVHLVSGRSLLIANTLAGVHATLPEQFVRVHKSYVVNGSHVTMLSPRRTGGRTLLLDEGGAVPVGRRYAEAITPWIAAVAQPV